MATRRRMKRRRPRRRRAFRPRTHNGLPVQLYRRLTYGQIDNSMTIDSLGSLAYKIFSMNSLFDPEMGAVGAHQPRGFDQLMTMFNQYLVIGATTFVDLAVPSISQAFIFGITISESSTALPSSRDYLESRLTRYASINPLAARNRFALKVNPNKFLGISHPKSEEDVKGTITTSPKRQVYLHVWGENLTQTQSFDINYAITNRFSSLFLNPIIPPIS